MKFGVQELQIKMRSLFRFHFTMCQREPHDCVHCCCDESEVRTRIRPLCVYLSGGRWRSSCHNIAHRRNTTSPSVSIVMMRLIAAPGTVLSSAMMILTWYNLNLARASQARPGSRHHSNWLLSDYLLQPGSMRNVLPKNDLNSGPLQPTARQGGAQADQGPLHLRWDNSSWQTIPGSKFKYKIKSGIFGRFVS